MNSGQARPELFHLVDPASNGPAGNPGLFSGLSNLLAEFGFMVAAVLGAAAGTTDLSDGVFRGVALDQLRPAALGAASLPGGGPGGPGRVLFGGRGALGIPPMPTSAMISVIVGWIVGWSVIGAWRMMTRDA